MRFFNWEVRLKIKKLTPPHTLPAKYDSYVKNQKLIVLPGQFYSPESYFEDLINQLRDDIYPLFRATTGGAPFTVTRNTLCFVDHTSQLLYGPRGNQTPKLKKVISQLGTVDDHLNDLYKKYASYLVQIYRHDLVHNIRPFPKQIMVKARAKTEIRETWFFMRTICNGKSFEDNFKDMLKKKSRKGRAHLRLAGDQVNIDTFSLFYDTVILLDQLKNKAKSDAKFKQKVTKNYYSIMQSHYYSIENFELDQTTNKHIVA